MTLSNLNILSLIFLCAFAKAEDCDKTNGTRQSPIDIETSDLTYRILPRLRWSIKTYKLRDTFTLTNTGYDFRFHQASKARRTLSGGDLEVVHRFEQLSFHWGTDDKRGSEHRVNNQSYPMEMHVRHIQNSSSSLDLYAVVAYFFNITKEDNPGFDGLLEAIPLVPHTNDTVTVNNFSLIPLVDTRFSRYYQYEGSLPIPPYTENIKWLIDVNPRGISERQINVFREAARRNPSMINNYRCVQPLNNREVDLVISV